MFSPRSVGVISAISDRPADYAAHSRTYRPEHRVIAPDYLRTRLSPFVSQSNPIFARYSIALP